MKRRYYIAALLMLSLLSLPIVGVRAAQAAEESTPGVGRVSLINGDVSTMRGDSGDWVATSVNAPISAGDKVSTADRSQTEIQLDYANVMRLAPQTQATVADLSRTVIQLQLAQGLMNFTVLKGTEAGVEIDTPNVAVRPLREGSYRIEVNPQGETRVIVREGEAEIATPQGSTSVGENKLITIEGTDQPEYQIANAPMRDDWDDWNRQRDSAISDPQSYRHTNQYYTGAQDLDRNGHWAQVPDYDWCWTPSVNAGWAPYRDGRWVWEPYWGWTWVSYEPWGWAPYHYGRWFLYSDSWYWWPGYSYYGYYPTWAPAYVSFLGFGFGGRNWNFGFGFGYNSIGWLPLGPYDRYHPWYGRNNRYNGVNITNVTNINGGGRVRNSGNRPYMSNVQLALNNPRVRQSITSASSEDFVNGRVSRNPRGVDVQTLRQAQVVRGTLPAVPTRASLRTTDRAVNPAAARAGAGRSENFFSRRQAPVVRQTFTERQGEIRQMMEKYNPSETVRNSGATGARANAAQNTAANVGSQSRGRPTQTPQATARGGAVSSANAGTQRAAENAVSNRQRTAVTQQTRATNTAQQANAANRPQTAQQGRPAAAPASTAGPGWQRFGGGSPANAVARSSTPGTVAAGRAAPQQSSAAPARTNENRQAQPARQPERPSNWQRFGTGSSRPAPGRSTTSAQPSQARPAAKSGATAGGRSGITVQGGEAASRPAAPRAVQPSSRATPRAAPSGSNWRQFSNTPSSRQAAPARAAPQATGGSAAPGRSFTSRPAPAGQGSNTGSWQRFEGQARSAPSSRGGTVSSPASRSPSSARPPLQIRKPIVTERSAPSRQFSGGGNYGSRMGGRSSSPPPRSMGRSSSPPRSSGGSYSQPPRSSVGRSSSPPRSSGGSYSQPSRSSVGRSSSPPRSSGGSYSQPSRSSGGSVSRSSGSSGRGGSRSSSRPSNGRGRR
jgi:Family of unknown function (DUF6600)/FecR protein